jgi:hypothetical protein
MERRVIIPVALGTLFVLAFLAACVCGEARASWKENGIPVCTSKGDQLSVESASDGAGGAIITWYNGGVLAQRVDASGSILWTTDGVSVSRAPGSQLPDLVEDGAGGAIITWNDERSGANPDIYAQRLDSEGRPLWPAEGVPVCTTACSERCRDMTGDGAGGAIVTWCDDRRAGDCDVYAQRLDSAGRVLWTMNGVPVCSADRAQGFPRVVSDGAGGAIITWADFRQGSDYWIYAQHLNASGAPLWQENGVPVCTTPGSKLPRIASDGAGGAIIAWRDPRTSSNYDIYAQRVSASGTMLWRQDGIPICTAAGAKWWPLIVSDGTGGAIVLWRDYRDGSSYDTYAQRVDPSGKVLWKKNGTLVCAGEYNERYHEMISDGAGGAIVSWYEEHLSGSYDIYAQRISPQGKPLWKTAGAVVCAAPEDQQFPVAVPDSKGGAILAWTDFRNGTDHDVYAQRVGPDGAVGSTGAAPRKPHPGVRR